MRGGYATTINLSLYQCDTFIATSYNINVGVTTSSAARGTLNFAGSASATIDVGSLTVSDSSNADQDTLNSLVSLGAGVNAITANTITIGGRKGNGTLNMVAGGTLTVLGQTAAGADLFVGDNDLNGTDTNAVGLVDASAGTFNGTLNDVVLGRYTAGSLVGGSGSGALQMAVGTVTANSLSLAVISGSATTPANTKGTFTQTGGSFTVDSGNTVVGQAGAGTMNIGGSAVFTTPDLVVAQLAGSTGVVNQTGGTINVTNPTTYTVGGAGSAVVNQTGGLTSVAGNMNVGTSSGTGVYNLSGPVASTELAFGDTSPVTQVPTATPSTLSIGSNGTFNFDDGTLSNVTDINIFNGPFVQDGGRLVIGVDGGLDPNNPLTQRATTTLAGGDFIQNDGTLAIDIFGPLGSSDADLFHILDNDAVLNGTLAVDLNTIEKALTWYDVLVADTITLGEDFNLEGTMSSRVIQDPTDPTRQILQVGTPEPASIALWTILGLAAAAGAWRKRCGLRRS